MTSSTRGKWPAVGICVMVVAVAIVLALTLASHTGIRVTIFNESPGAVQVEVWKDKERILEGTILGKQSATCTFIPPGSVPLKVRIETPDKTFEKELDLYYETGYTGSIRIFFENGEITYEHELEMPGPSFGPRPTPRRRS